ncbi:hypothetical protein [Sphingomonas morindae]|uniref:5-bromo-4-chloroindolyl phosphate hydrolysis protein n=1 Tax=Sphingomonas morindae TaxID=1541170 RepID=A0ABY4X743_9SPHN|nr:hypothetical protein [Sphingomonas morindae]USI72675.1 hypothetical protein LHA26_15560 [Sphingomonas morindae]
MASSDDILSHAAELLRRLSPEGRAAALRRRERRMRAAKRMLKRLLIGTMLVLAAAAAIGFVVPIGIGGVFATLLALILVWTLVLGTGRTVAPRAEQLATTDLARLPADTGAWLDRQRLALPAPAQRQIDQLESGLAALAPQLSGLDPRQPEALEVRRLIADELPELIRGYQRVPPTLRRTPIAGGTSPDRQLADGLATIGEELARMNQRLADKDLKALATQNRYLEIKYRGDDQPPA